MSLRMSGLVSGMDTEGMVTQLMDAHKLKLDGIKKKQTLSTWKKETWQGLNTKIYDFYKTSLNIFKTNSTYNAKTANSSDPKKANVSALSGATNGTHTLSVKQLATSAYLTGGKITATANSKLSDLGISVGTSFSVNGKDYVVDDTTTVKSFTAELNKMGVSANFDSSQGRLYVNSNKSGADNDFNITATDSAALDTLGLSISSGMNKINAKDAIIDYNGVEYKSSTNQFNINNLNITATGTTGDYNESTGVLTNNTPISINVTNDTEGIYDNIKKFVKEYNSLIEEMNGLYTERKTDYEPLTEEEKNQLSESQIEKWEKSAKQGVLGRDSTISSMLSSMRTILNKGVEVDNGDGTTSRFSLASLGIVTGDYSEKGKLHIEGDSDFPAYADKTNKLKDIITTRPEVLSSVFAGTNTKPGLGLELYNNLTRSMRSSSTSSALTFFNDKTIDKEINDFDKKSKDFEKKLAKIEDKYYKQFASMESAMAKLQSQQTYMAQLMGSGK